MKKILSVMTAVSVAMTAMLSAVTVTAAEKITADEVREMIYSTGLKAYPELWDKTINDINAEKDVLKTETRILTDVADINRTYRIFPVNSDTFTVDETYEEQPFFDILGFDNDGNRISVMAYPPGKKNASWVLDYSLTIGDYVHDPIDFFEDYETIAEIINNENIDTITDIKLLGNKDWFGVYLLTKSGNEYILPTSDYTDNYAEKLDKEVKRFKQNCAIEFKEWCELIEEFSQNKHECIDKGLTDAVVINPEDYMDGDEIRNTDTRAAYIGTESKFSDVSGDLASYVNELNDLGIINGYDENLFMPENTLTRAEAAAMFTRMLKYSGKYNGEFKDVSADDWFANDVSALVTSGLINGYDETTFAPYENIKYQEVMKILVYALGYGAYYMENFPDSYPSETNSKAMQIGLTESLKSFDTTAPITRGDMAVMLSNALDTHLFTEVGGGKNEELDISFTTYEEDITLIDYINGRKLNGKLEIPKKSED